MGQPTPNFSLSISYTSPTLHHLHYTTYPTPPTLHPLPYNNPTLPTLHPLCTTYPTPTMHHLPYTHYALPTLHLPYTTYSTYPPLHHPSFPLSVSPQTFFYNQETADNHSIYDRHITHNANPYDYKIIYPVVSTF